MRRRVATFLIAFLVGFGLTAVPAPAEANYNNVYHNYDGVGWWWNLSGGIAVTCNGGAVHILYQGYWTPCYRTRYIQANSGGQVLWCYVNGTGPYWYGTARKDIGNSTSFYSCFIRNI